MLEELNVRNFALVDSLVLSFDKGFTVLTGETGAGKSIIVGSLSFLLGAKVSEGLIRTGCDEASVSAVVSIDNNKDALEWLLARDITLDEGKLIIRRNIKANGRGTIFIQNVLVSRNDLQEFMSFLFDLHGQHNHETLLRKETHRRYLDRFAGLEEEALAFNRVFLNLAGKRKELEASLSSEKSRDERIEILEYGRDEVSKANPKPGESQELEIEAKKLAEYEKLLVQINTASFSFFDDEVSLLSCAKSVKTSIDNASAIDADLMTISKKFESFYFEIEDIAKEFRSYQNRLNYDSARLEELEERLNLLYKLKKKYVPSKSLEKSSEEDIIAWKIEAENELLSLKNMEENRDKLKSDIAELEKEMAARSSSLSAKRREASKLLGKNITKILINLGMPNARFEATVSSKASEAASLVCGPWGADDVEFMISANTGEPLKELTKIASGGELSRVMLAIKTILSKTKDSVGIQDSIGSQDSIGQDSVEIQDSSPETLIFDEIDTGIGGEVAIFVGEYLSHIGNQKQIFCVTHLASIAVRCNNHLKVEKKVVKSGNDSRTITTVTLLDRKQEREEIARMLAGDSGDAALAHADDLIAKYKRSSDG